MNFIVILILRKLSTILYTQLRQESTMMKEANKAPISLAPHTHSKNYKFTTLALKESFLPSMKKIE